jgi:hypothetical protein
MRLELVFTDLTTWQGAAPEYARAPLKDVLILWVFPREGERVQVSGWDHYSVRVIGDTTHVARWKDAESFDRDGSLDPYAGMGAVQAWRGGELVLSTPYALFDGGAFRHLPYVRHGRWVPDDVARAAGIL